MTGFEAARARNLPPTLIIECAGNCTNTFALADGFPWPVIVEGQETPHLAFFCSGLCVLKLMPPKSCMGRA
jgi:hypothetical protein